MLLLSTPRKPLPKRPHPTQIKPAAEINQHKIEHDKSDKDGETAPPERIVDVETSGLFFFWKRLEWMGWTAEFRVKFGQGERREIPREKRGKKTKTYKLIPTRILAELAQSPRTILNITASLGNELQRITLTRLARRRGETGKFIGATNDRDAMNGHSQQTLEQILEGRQPVHP